LLIIVVVGRDEIIGNEKLKEPIVVLFLTRSSLIPT